MEEFSLKREAKVKDHSRAQAKESKKSTVESTVNLNLVPGFAWLPYLAS